MAAKNENLPINADIDLHNGGTIKYANEVIAIIAGVAAGEVDGIAGMCTSGGIGDIISRNRNVTRGIKVEMGGEEVSVDIYTIVEYGQPIHKVALEVQENVRKAIETMTGLHVVKVDIHVQGVSFEKENMERDAAIEATKTPALEEAKPAKKKSAKKAAEKPQPELEVKAEEAPQPAGQDAPKAEPEQPAPEAEKAEPAPEAAAEPETAPEEAAAEPAAAEETAQEAPAAEAGAEEQQTDETENTDEVKTAGKRKPRRKA